MTNKQKLLPRSARLILLASVIAAITSMFIAPPANSEESTYESIVDGELAFTATALAPGADITVFGDVFALDASVEFGLTNVDNGAVLRRDQLTTDDDGNIEFSFSLPSEMVTAEYRAEISGLTEDGAFVSLEKRFDIIGNVTELQTTTVATSAPTTEAAVPDTVDSSEASATGEVAAGEVAETQDFDSSRSNQTAAEVDTDTSESTSAAIWIVTVIIVAGLGAIVVIMRRRSSAA